MKVIFTYLSQEALKLKNSVIEFIRNEEQLDNII